MKHRSNRSALFDGIEEGGIRGTLYSNNVNEQDNDKALDGLHDRVNILKRLTGDIHEEVQSHNRVLDGMGNLMDASRGTLSGTVDRFKIVFEKKSSRRMCTLVSAFVILFLVLYFLMKFI
ncbi:Bet1-like SNARE 1-1 [Ranunculus cassubicifolius]